MKSLAKLLVVLAVSAAATAPAAAQRGTPDPERAAARQVIIELATYLQDGKWTEADGLFATRGLHVLADTSAYHTWAEYRDKSVKPELARFIGLKVTHSAVEAVVRHGSVAWVAFRQEIGGSGAPAAAVKVSRGSAVMEKLEGKWVIVHYHISR